MAKKTKEKKLFFLTISVSVVCCCFFNLFFIRLVWSESRVRRLAFYSPWKTTAISGTACCSSGNNIFPAFKTALQFKRKSIELHFTSLLLDWLLLAGLHYIHNFKVSVFDQIFLFFLFSVFLFFFSSIYWEKHKNAVFLKNTKINKKKSITLTTTKNNNNNSQNFIWNAKKKFINCYDFQTSRPWYWSKD